MLGDSSALHVSLPSSRAAHWVSQPVDSSAAAPINARYPAKWVCLFRHLPHIIVLEKSESSCAVSDHGRIQTIINDLFEGGIRMGYSNDSVQIIVIEAQGVAAYVRQGLEP